MTDFFDLSDAAVGEPVSIVGGSLTQWRRELDVDPTLFGLEYRFRQGTAQVTQSLLQIDDGPYWGAELPATLFDGQPSGQWLWDLVVTRTADGAAKLLDHGTVDIFGDADDRRSHAQIMVSKIQSILENRADDDVENYTIKNRSISKMSIADLMKWRDYYREEAASTSATAGVFAKPKPRGNRLFVRFHD